MDLGCYPVHWLRTLSGAEPEVVSAAAVEGAPGVDVELDAELRWAEGTVGRIFTSMQPAERSAWVRVVGARGSMLVENPLAPHLGHRITVRDQDGESFEVVDGDTTYAHQLAAVIDGLATGDALPTEGDDGVANMVVIDACYRACGLEPRRST